MIHFDKKLYQLFDIKTSRPFAVLTSFYVSTFFAKLLANKFQHEIKLQMSIRSCSKYWIELTIWNLNWSPLAVIGIKIKLLLFGCKIGTQCLVQGWPNHCLGAKKVPAKKFSSAVWTFLKKNFTQINVKTSWGK